MSWVRHLPNALTLGNLLCGCIGILMLHPALNLFNLATPGRIFLVQPGYFVVAACVFDFLDGFTARALKVTSPIGKQLDSLADMVSFGVLPSLAMAWMIYEKTPFDGLSYFAFLLAAGSALRLARFNIDETQKDSFSGLPTPANALFITGLCFAIEDGQTWLLSPYLLIGVTVVFSYLMVSGLRLIAFKFDRLQWQGNELKLTFLGLAVLLVVLLGWSAQAPIILLYLAVSLVYTRVRG
jgi:CDP-diacylglycerol--serine O-phosphatidyltransferase